MAHHPHQQFNLDILSVIASFTHWTTLQVGLSLASRTTLQASRPYLVHQIHVDIHRILEYHTLVCDAYEAGVPFSLPLHYTKVLHVSLPCIGRQEIAALSHLIRATGMQLKEFVMYGNLRMDRTERAYNNAHFVAPLKGAFAGTVKFGFSSTNMTWVEDLLFWVAVCPNTVVLATTRAAPGIDPTEGLFSTSTLLRAISTSYYALPNNGLSDVILQGAVSPFSKHDPGCLVQCTFPARELVVKVDPQEHLLKLVKFWNHLGMNFYLMRVTLEGLHWDDRQGMALLHHLLSACSSTLQELTIDELHEQGKCCSSS